MSFNYAAVHNFSSQAHRIQKYVRTCWQKWWTWWFADRMFVWGVMVLSPSAPTVGTCLAMNNTQNVCHICCFGWELYVFELRLAGLMRQLSATGHLNWILYLTIQHNFSIRVLWRDEYLIITFHIIHIIIIWYRLIKQQVK